MSDDMAVLVITLDEYRHLLGHRRWLSVVIADEHTISLPLFESGNAWAVQVVETLRRPR